MPEPKPESVSNRDKIIAGLREAIAFVKGETSARVTLASTPSSLAVEGELVKRLGTWRQNCLGVSGKPSWHPASYEILANLLDEAAAALQSRSAVEAETIEKCAGAVERKAELVSSNADYELGLRRAAQIIRSLLPTASRCLAAAPKEGE